MDDIFVDFPMIVKFLYRDIHIELTKTLKGAYSKGDPPLPIPNREVKPFHADGTALRVGE